MRWIVLSLFFTFSCVATQDESYSEWLNQKPSSFGKLIVYSDGPDLEINSYLEQAGVDVLNELGFTAYSHAELLKKFVKEGVKDRQAFAEKNGITHTIHFFSDELEERSNGLMLDIPGSPMTVYRPPTHSTSNVQVLRFVNLSTYEIDYVYYDFEDIKTAGWVKKNILGAMASN